MKVQDSHSALLLLLQLLPGFNRLRPPTHLHSRVILYLLSASTMSPFMPSMNRCGMFLPHRPNQISDAKAA